MILTCASQVMTIVVSVYDIRGAYTTVLCAVNEQLKNFAATNIKNDGRTPADLAFETALEVRHISCAHACLIWTYESCRLWKMFVDRH